MRGFHRGDQRNVRQSSTAVNYSRPGAFPSTIKFLRSHPLVAEYRAFVFAAPPFLLVEFLVRFRGPPSGSFLTDQMPWIGLSILLRQTSFFCFLRKGFDFPTNSVECVDKARVIAPRKYVIFGEKWGRGREGWDRHYFSTRERRHTHVFIIEPLRRRVLLFVHASHPSNEWKNITRRPPNFHITSPIVSSVSPQSPPSIFHYSPT